MNELPCSDAQAKAYKQLWSGTRTMFIVKVKATKHWTRNRKGVATIWTRLRKPRDLQRRVKNGELTQEVVDSWKGIPTPTVKSRLCEETKRLGFPTKKEEVGCKKTNWFRTHPARNSFLFEVYKELQVSCDTQASLGASFQKLTECKFLF